MTRKRNSDSYRVGEVDGNPLGTGKMIVFLYLKNAALGMPDSRFSIIDEKTFFNLNLKIRVHPIHHFRRRCYFCAGYHANRLEQTTHFFLLGGF